MKDLDAVYLMLIQLLIFFEQPWVYCAFSRLFTVMLNAAKESIGLSVGKPKPYVVYKLRDVKTGMVEAWKVQFADYADGVEVSYGDIFKGAPAADAIVSPANSFGFMDGGIDMYYSVHFGWQMQERLQEVIHSKKDGEIIVGDAVIIPAYSSEEEAEKMLSREAMEDLPKEAVANEGKPIKWLISAPTMRIPEDVSATVNAYLAFRAVILAVKKHNADPSNEPIRSVLCPGLGTAVGKMPKEQCALQMRLAYEKYELGMHTNKNPPESLHQMSIEHDTMILRGYNFS